MFICIPVHMRIYVCVTCEITNNKYYMYNKYYDSC